MRKYIFFDIDGVLNTQDSWSRPYQIMKEKVNLLAEISKKTKSDLILTSTWKKGFCKDINLCSPQIQTLRKIMQDNNVDIFDTTPDLRNRSRDKEIERYLYFKPCDRYVTIDDDDSLFVDKECLYLINPKKGLQKEDVKKNHEKALILTY